MGDNLAVRVEAIDTAVLYGTPCDVVFSWRNGRNTAADDVALGGETPRVEGLLPLVEQVESFLVAAYP